MGDKKGKKNKEKQHKQHDEKLKQDMQKKIDKKPAKKE